MSMADEFRMNADACMRMAEAMKHPEERAAWMALARMWLRRLKALAS
jgi:hypothetical protein